MHLTAIRRSRAVEWRRQLVLNRRACLSMVIVRLSRLSRWVLMLMVICLIFRRVVPRSRVRLLVSGILMRFDFGSIM